jgi:hypothetical protein
VVAYEVRRNEVTVKLLEKREMFYLALSHVLVLVAVLGFLFGICFEEDEDEEKKEARLKPGLCALKFVL